MDLAKTADNFLKTKCFWRALASNKTLCHLKTPASHKCGESGESLMSTTLDQGVHINFPLVADPFNFTMDGAKTKMLGLTFTWLSESSNVGLAQMKRMLENISSCS